VLDKELWGHVGHSFANYVMLKFIAISEIFALVEPCPAGNRAATFEDIK
jgi:hypothetical protein